MAAVGNGNIFVLCGTSSTGKSSVIHALKEKDPSWVEMGPDLAEMHYVADLIKDAFPAEYAKMAQGLEHGEIAKAVLDSFFKAKESLVSQFASLRWRDGNAYSQPEILKLIQSVARDPSFSAINDLMFLEGTNAKVHQKMVDFICQQSSQGHPVFVDGMGPDKIDEFQRQTSGYPVTVGLAYVPLNELAERVTKRNASGDPAEVRSYRQITEQFLEHFQLAAAGDPVVDEISEDAVDVAFSKMQPKDQEEAKALGDLRSRLITEYKLSGSNRVPLASRIPYQVLVKTMQTPEESARQILDSFHSGKS